MNLTAGVTHYELAGPPEGQTVVLLHGLSVPYYMWDKNFAAIADAGFRVLRYDFYGRGYSDRPEVTYDLNLYDRQLTELLSSLGIDGKVDLVGVSMGTAIGASFAARHSEKVRRVCLIDPAGVSDSLPISMSIMRMPVLGDYLIRVLGDRKMPDSQKDDFCTAEACPADYLERYRDQMQYKGFKRAILSTLRNVSLPEIVELYANLGHGFPVLLIWGREDKTTPFADNAKLRQRIPHAEFHAIDQAGHVPQYEKPEEVNRLVIDFLKQDI